MVKILVLDNYDSFVYTLNGYLQQLGAETEVLRNDVVSEAELPALLANYDAVLLSPGPGTPADAGLGATVRQADELMHGKTSQVAHDNSLIFKDVAQPFTATRYHSLAVVDSTVPADLVVTARTEKGKNSAGGVIMGLQHATKPIYGVQYHPESVLTEGGYLMLGNWLESLGLVGAAERGKALSPMVKL